MAKDLNISILLDFYGEMLTEKQRDAVELYYNEDLSLAEIAEHMGITRQGVRDSIKRGENQLLECEEKLGLVERFGGIRGGVQEIVDNANALLREKTITQTLTVQKKVERIIELANQIGL